CVGYDAILDPVKEFFGGTPNPSDGYCQPSCAAGCPEHYLCDGDFCKPDVSWAAPEPTLIWDGAVGGVLVGRDQSTTVEVEEGSVVSVIGTAASPVDAAIVSTTWTTVSADGDYMQFEDSTIEIETTVPFGAGNYRRVEFTATDERARSSVI